MIEEFFDPIEAVEKREELRKKLKFAQGGCLVTFLKLDGSLREMVCTLNEQLIPARAFPDKTKAEDKTEGVPATVSPSSKRKTNPETLSVWSLEDKGWRSFHVFNVIDCAVMEIA